VRNPARAAGAGISKGSSSPAPPTVRNRRRLEISRISSVILVPFGANGLLCMTVYIRAARGIFQTFRSNMRSQK